MTNRQRRAKAKLMAEPYESKLIQDPLNETTMDELTTEEKLQQVTEQRNLILFFSILFITLYIL